MMQYRMVDAIPVILADFTLVKGLALLGLVVVVFLYWDDFKERRRRRREKRELEERRRQSEAQKEARNR